MNNLYDITSYSPRVLVNKDKNIAFYWSPKAGCSVVAKIFLKYINYYNNDNNPVIEQRDSYITQQINSTTNICDRSNQNNLCYKNYFKIQMVRNPYTRAISSYLKYLHIYRNISLSFHKYLELILTKTMKEHHIWPQYLIPPTSLDYIIRFENMESDILDLCSKHNICFEYSTEPVEPSYTRFTNDTTNNCANIDYRFIDDNIIINSINNITGIPPYYLFYNTDCKLLVEQIYGYDIEIFKYEFPYVIT
jgi:hypothetical protein